MKTKMKIVLGTLSLLLCLSSPGMATSISFDINAGGYGYETGWSIRQLTGGSWQYGMATGSMASYVLYSFDWDLDAGSYNLLMTDSWGDGLDGTGGMVRLVVDGSTLLDQVGNVFGSSYSLNFDVPTSGPAPVPEPSTFLLLGGGLAGLAWVGRKRTQV